MSYNDSKSGFLGLRLSSCEFVELSALGSLGVGPPLVALGSCVQVQEVATPSGFGRGSSGLSTGKREAPKGSEH